MYPELTEIKNFEEVQREERGQFVKLPVEKIVCPRCRGEGKHTNPAVDGNGLSPDDPDLDEEFWDTYRTGGYDIPCEVCKGKNVVDEVDEKALEANNPELHAAWKQWIEDAYDYAAERAAEMRAGC